MSAVRKFVTAVKERYGMRPVVPFEQPVSIGDIGTIGKDGTWNPLSTTKLRFDVTPEKIRSTKDGRGVWDASSGKNVTFNLYGNGQTSKLIKNVADAKARAEIMFGSRNSWVFAAKGVTVRSATKFSELIEEIRSAYHERHDRPEKERWYKDFVFIFAVGDADQLTAMLARRAKTTVALTGRGSVGPPSTVVSLAAGIDFGTSSDDYQSINQSPAAGRLYRAYRLERSILKKWDEKRLVAYAKAPPPPTFEETFTEV